MIEETDTDIEVRKYADAQAARELGIELYPRAAGGTSINPLPTDDFDQYVSDLQAAVDTFTDPAVGLVAGTRQGAQELIDSGIDFLGSEASKFFQYGGFGDAIGMDKQRQADLYRDMELNTRKHLNERGLDTELPLKSLQPETEIGIGIREMTAYVSNFLLGRPQITKVKGLGDSVLDTVGDWGYRLLSNVRANSLGAHALNPEESNLSQLAVELGFVQELNDFYAEGSVADRMSEGVADRLSMMANPSVRGMELDAEQRLLRKVDTIVEDNAAGGVLAAGVLAAAKAFKAAAMFPKTVTAGTGGAVMTPEEAEPAPLSAVSRAAKPVMSTADNMGGGVSFRLPGADIDGANTRVKEIARERLGTGTEFQLAPKLKVTVPDLHKYFDELAVQKYGRQLDIVGNPKDLATVQNELVEDIVYQSKQEVSGAGWYDADVLKTFSMLARMPGFESLMTSETDRVIMSAILGATSPGPKVAQNTKAAAAQFLMYKQTGKFSTEAPPPGTAVAGVEKAGFGQYGYPDGLRMLQHLLDKYGEEGFADWFLSPHSRSELTALRNEAGFKSGPGGMKGAADSQHFGAAILGDKAGLFALNINGYGATTKDKWFVRTIRRAEGSFGSTVQKNGQELGQPRNVSERAVMDQLIRDVISDPRLADLGLSEQDAQAILWFREQNLYTDLGVRSVPQTFSEGVEKLSGQAGFGIRGGDETKAAIEQGEAGVDDYRSVSKSQRAVRANRRRQLESLNNPGGEGSASKPYGRDSSSDDGRVGSLVPNADTQARYERAGLRMPTIEIKGSDHAAEYYDAMNTAMSAHKYGAQVEIKSVDDLKGMKLHRTSDGGGFAIKPDGDVVAVFNPSEAPRGGIYAVMQAAVEAGGLKLDAFDTMLPGIYETVGFKPVARVPWNDEFAPPGWSKETFAEFNNGEPDVVLFVYDPDYFGGVNMDDVPVFNDYDAAVQIQNTEVSRLHGSQMELTLQ